MERDPMTFHPAPAQATTRLSAAETRQALQLVIEAWRLLGPAPWPKTTEWQAWMRRRGQLVYLGEELFGRDPRWALGRFRVLVAELAGERPPADAFIADAEARR